MAKPILLIKFKQKDGEQKDKFFEGVQSIRATLTDYHVLAAIDESYKGLTFELIKQKKKSDKEIEELIEKLKTKTIV